MKSMTGFGRANFELDGKQYSVEIAAVNQKGLSLGIYVPTDWNSLLVERLLSPVVKEYATRGKINIYIKAEVVAGTAGDFEIDKNQFKAVFGKICELAHCCNVNLQADGNAVLKAIEICQNRGNAKLTITEKSQEKMLAGTRAALEAFSTMRQVEGENLKKDLRERVLKLRKIAEQIEVASAGTVAHFRDALLARLKALELDALDCNDERVLKEITIFADRCDISEERTRLASHLQQFENTMNENGDCGRKLDFICQEILRELNTMGSKANNLEITRLVVEAKNEQERLREQVQNVE